MYCGKYQRKSKISALRLIFTCVILLVVAIGGVSAYLSISSPQASNSLSEAPYPEVSVSETTVTVKPNGYAVFLRVAVDVYWKSRSVNSNTILAEEPSGWFVDDKSWKEIDGFYYYRTPITTETVLTAVTLGNMQKDGYDLAVNVAAQVVQAVGETDVDAKSAVEDAWGVTIEQITGSNTTP